MATNTKSVISRVREFIKDDNLSLFYQGKFDHNFTALIIDLGRNAAETLTNRTGKNRMGFLMAESFQNIVKHGLGAGSLSKISKEVFGLRSIHPFMHIFSSNEVDPKTAELLSEKLGSLEGMTVKDLNQKYMEILKHGDISEKGGAGLGLIEMARKSKQPLQHVIIPSETGESSGFGLQIDMLMDKELIDQELDKLNLNENVRLHRVLQDEKVILLFNGDFSKETIVPVLEILKRNAENSLVDAKKFSKLYHIAVELFQNVMRHGAERNGVKFGTFALAIGEDDYLALSTGNYVTDEQETHLKDCIDHLNTFPDDQLDKLYMETLRASAREESGGGNVGMIDIARITSKNIEYECIEDEHGKFFSITAHFK